MNRYAFTNIKSQVRKPKPKIRSGRWCICSVCGKEMDLDGFGWICPHLKPQKKESLWSNKGLQRLG